jgi:hypothetical protein
MGPDQLRLSRLCSPNVKDEPRRELARRVQHYDSLSLVSFRSSFGRTRRDRSRRWLWRLVRHGWNLDVPIQRIAIRDPDLSNGMLENYRCWNSEKVAIHDHHQNTLP